MSNYNTGLTCAFALYTKDTPIHIGNLIVRDGDPGAWSYAPNPKGPYQSPHLLGCQNGGSTEWENNILRLRIPHGKLFGALKNFSFLDSAAQGTIYQFENAEGDFDARFFQYSNVPQTVAMNSSGMLNKSNVSALSGFVVRVN